MKLDRSTYEAWLLDRLEGRLSAAQERELDTFLAANPDLPTTDLDAALPTIDPAAPRHPDKAALQQIGDELIIALLEGDLAPDLQREVAQAIAKDPELSAMALRYAQVRIQGEGSFEQKNDLLRGPEEVPLPELQALLIAELEGDLSTSDRARLDELVRSHPEHEQERRAFAATVLHAPSIAYPDKDGLRREQGRVVALWPRLAVAASIAALLGLATWLLWPKTEHPVVPELAGFEQVKEETKGPATESMVEQPVEQDDAHEVPIPAQKDEAVRTPTLVPVQTEPRDKHLADNANTEEPSMEEPVLDQAEEAIEKQPLLAEVEEKPVPIDQGTAVVEIPDEEEELLARVDPSPDRVLPEREIPELSNALVQHLRRTVLNEQDSRPLDADDAVAFVDRGIQAVSGGMGGVKVERQGKRITRLHLRLGHDLGFSASRGR
ncbi:MAG: hypothetical protein KDB88_04100 [Flavobacteriales bacterium]|nr:hypothetical protein [Flavobacteriales bacterium]